MTPSPELGDGTPTAGSGSGDEGVGRPVIAVDLDEVLGRFLLPLCQYHNDVYGTKLTPGDFNSYLFHEVWGGTREESDNKMREFFDSRYFNDGIPVIEGAAEVLRKHSQSLELHVVTSRQNILEKHTREWIDKHFAGIFAECHFGNHFSKDGSPVKSKPDLCKGIGAVMMIDDNTGYATECAAVGIRTCLFGNYAWNQTPEGLSDKVHRTITWADVDKELQSVAAAVAVVEGDEDARANQELTTNFGEKPLVDNQVLADSDGASGTPEAVAARA